MLKYERVKNSNSSFLALTGLKIKEFDDLFIEFDRSWKELENDIYLNKTGVIPRLSNNKYKLFFILVYFKTYPIQELQGLIFDLPQSEVSRWVKRLTIALNKALGYKKELPARKTKNFKQLLENNPEIICIIDATAKDINRPIDNEEQKLTFNGKTRRNNKKNTVISNLKDKKIIFLGKTCNGSKHDKKMADEDMIEFPKGTVLLKDTGYEGYEPDGVIVVQPKKKPRNGKLSEGEKAINRFISRSRVRVEHAIRGIKISRIVKDRFRNKRAGFDDFSMETACGLHNFRVESRKIA